MFERRNDKPGAGPLDRTGGLAIATVTAVAVASIGHRRHGRRTDRPAVRRRAAGRTMPMMSVQWAVDERDHAGLRQRPQLLSRADTLNRAHMVTFLKRYHDKFGSDASDANDASDDSAENSDDPEEHVTSMAFGSSDSVLDQPSPAGRYYG